MFCIVTAGDRVNESEIWQYDENDEMKVRNEGA